MSTTISNNFQGLLAERERIQAASQRISEQGSRIAEARGAAEREQSEANAASRDFEAAVAEAIGADMKIPEPPASLRTALAKAQTAQTKKQALLAAEAALNRDAANCASKSAAIEAQIRSEIAAMLGQQYLGELAKQRGKMDEMNTSEQVGAGIHRAMFAADARVATAITHQAEELRVEWLRSRDARIDEQAAKRYAELIAEIPN